MFLIKKNPDKVFPEKRFLLKKTQTKIPLKSFRQKILEKKFRKNSKKIFYKNSRIKKIPKKFSTKNSGKEIMSNFFFKFSRKTNFSKKKFLNKANEKNLEKKNTEKYFEKSHKSCRQ